VKKVKRGDKVVVPFTIACGKCFFCKHNLWSACDNTNPNAWMMEKMYGYSGSGLFGYSHMMGGYAGGQAQYVRVPFADVGALQIPDGVPDDKVLFLSDIFPTGYMAAENCDIQPGDVIAIWGCGPVGQFAIRSALLLGAAKVIAIDRFPESLQLAERGGAEVLDYSRCDDVVEELKFRTRGRGPDACIDAVGMEAHATSISGLYDEIETRLMLETDRPMVLRQAIQACRKGGTVSIPGVYSGFINKLNFGAAFGKGLTLKMGQTNMHKYMQPLLRKIMDGLIDPSEVISHRVGLRDAPRMYKVFREKRDHCTKVVLDPKAA
jgi:threonine dehydrogenase-like Zn-dependent dehydrogenase